MIIFKKYIYRYNNIEWFTVSSKAFIKHFKWTIAEEWEQHRDWERLLIGQKRASYFSAREGGLSGNGQSAPNHCNDGMVRKQDKKVPTQYPARELKAY